MFVNIDERMSLDQFMYRYSNTAVNTLDYGPAMINSIEENEINLTTLEGTVYCSVDDFVFDDEYPELGYTNTMDRRGGRFVRSIQRAYKRGFDLGSIQVDVPQGINSTMELVSLAWNKNFVEIEEGLQLIRKRHGYVGINPDFAVKFIPSKKYQETLLYNGLEVGKFIDNVLIMPKFFDYVATIIPFSYKVELI